MTNRTPDLPSHLFAGLFMLALAIVAASAIGAWAVRDIKRASDTVTVTGSARRAIVSDLIVWRGSVSCQRSDLKVAFRDIKSDMDKVNAYLRENKVPEEDVTIHSIETYPVYGQYPDGRMASEVVAYNLNQTFEVRSSDVEAISQLSRKITDLIERGIQLQSYPPQYLYTKLADLRIEMLGEATKDAKTRAEMLAENAGFEVGGVRSARTGVFQITPRHSTEISDYGMNDVSSMEKEITAVVSITFAVK